MFHGIVPLIGIVQHFSLVNGQHMFHIVERGIQVRHRIVGDVLPSLCRRIGIDVLFGFGFCNGRGNVSGDILHRHVIPFYFHDTQFQVVV